jgi:hypothetical protein
MIRTSPRSCAGRRPGHPFFRPSFERLESRRLPSGAASPTLLSSYADGPMMFEANQGQTAAQVRFLSRGDGYALFLTDNQAVLSLTKPSGAAASTVLTMQLAGGSLVPRVVGLGELAARSNYLRGNDPSQWLVNVPEYASVAYQDVYPGIDLTYHGSGQHLEYDFTVAPSADPGAIRLSFQGDTGREIDAQDDLVLHTTGGDVVEHAPVIYQEDGTTRQTISGGFVLGADGSVGFAVGAYDRGRPLVIDPVLAYSTYLGNSVNGGFTAAKAVAADKQGNVYLTGSVSTSEFPFAPNGVQTAFNGYGNDAFVAKLDATGHFVYFTYLGGQPDESHVHPDPELAAEGIQQNIGFQYAGTVGRGIAVDASGNVYVAGSTHGLPFGSIASMIGFMPTVNAFQPNYGGGSTDGWVAKLDPTGAHLVYSSYLGTHTVLLPQPGGGLFVATEADTATAIAVDGAGNAFVVGNASPELNFHTALVSRTFVARVNANGTLAWDNYFGDDQANTDSNAVTVDNAGHVYFAGGTNAAGFANQVPVAESLGGIDAFVAELDAGKGQLLTAIRLGGNMAPQAPALGTDYAEGVAVDGGGNVYVTGTTFTPNFPTTPGALQTAKGREFTADGDGPIATAFVAKLSGDLSQLLYSTLLGGTQGVEIQLAGGRLTDLGVGEFGHAIAVDGNGDAYVAGSSGSTDFPAVDAIFPYHTPEAAQTTPGGPIQGPSDGFIAELAPDGSSLIFSSYLGGTGNDVATGIALDGLGGGYVVGTTDSTDFPTTASGVQTSYSHPAGYTFSGVSEGFFPTRDDNFFPDPLNPITSAFVTRLAPPLRVTALPVSAFLGLPYTRPVATFTAVDPTETVGDFQVTIDWGDGTVTPGFVTATGDPTQPFQVSGNHTYLTLGSYPVEVHVTDTKHSIQATTAVDVSRAPDEQSETTIAVDPSNPRRLFAASNDDNGIFAAYSTDGGVTWTRATDDRGFLTLGSPPGQSEPGPDKIGFGNGDPRVAFDSFGNLYLTALQSHNNGLALLTSADGGRTFRVIYSVTPGGFGPFQNPEDAVVDQPSLAVGPGDLPGTGSVWISYSDYSSHIDYAAGARVTGLGQVGPFTAVDVSHGPFGSFGNIAVGPAGQVAVAWQNEFDAAGYQTNAIMYTLNPRGIADPTAFGPVTEVGSALAVNFTTTIPAQPDRGVTPDIRLAWDRSGGPHNGRLYMVYTDKTDPVLAPNDTDILLRYSDNNGATWSAVTRVNDDKTSNSQFFPSVAVDQTDGDVAVAWYDARNDPSNAQVEYLVAVSGDGGQTFSGNVAVTVGPSNANLAERGVAAGDRNQLGDYEGLDFNRGLLYPVWTDNSTQLRGNPNRPEMELAAACVAVAHVTAAPPVVTAVPLSLTEGDIFSGTVASFTEGDPALGSADFQATIDWGDGSAPSSGAITQVGDPTFEVHGTHSYKTPGAYVVKVTVTDTVHNLVATTVNNASQDANAEAEPNIAIDPNNPARLFAVAMGRMLFAATSADGGVTWQRRAVADGSDGLPVFAGDPKVAFDSYGNLFLTYVTPNDLGGPDDTAVAVALSTDGGQTFRLLEQFDTLGDTDQPSVAVGPGRGGKDGSVWVCFATDDPLTPLTIEAAGASVSGLNQVGPFGIAQAGPAPPGGNGRNFGDIAVGPDGQVMIVSQTGVTAAGPAQVFVNLDADGLGNKGFAGDILATRTNVGGRDLIPPQNIRGVDAEASLAWDRTGGPHRGRLYLAYTDAPAVGDKDTNIFVRYSDDSGKTWSAPVRVNDDTAGNSQFLPAIAVDPTTGDVAVSWYDGRNDAAGVKAELFAAVSGDGGATFSRNVRVSPGASDATDPRLTPGELGIQYGDYAGLVFQGGILYPVWVDNSAELGQNPGLPSFDVAVARTGTAHVADAPLTAKALDISADVNDEGEGLSADLATFTDPDPNAKLDLYTATIDWGDKTNPAQGTVRAGGDGFVVSGKHAYEEEGSYRITVTIKDRGGAEVKVTLDADVEDGKLTAVGPTMRPAEGVPFTGAVASFTDSDPNGQPDDYVSAIDWGDGTQTAGRVVFDGTAALAWDANYQEVIAIGKPSSGPDAGVNSLLLLGNTQSGLTTPLLRLGPDFHGGLAVDNQQRIYAVSNNDAGESFLNLLDLGAGKSDPVAYLGTGFTGGLTFDAHDGHFYAIATTGADSTLFAIDPATWAVRPVADLGALAFSGLAFDPFSTGTMYAVANDGDGQSTLYRIALGAAAGAQSLFVLGTGYTGGVAAALTVHGGFVTEDLVGVAGDGSGSAVLNVINLSGVVSPAYEVGSQFNDGFAVVGTHAYAEEGTLPLSVHVKDVGSSAATAAATAQIVDDPPAPLPAPAAVSAFQGFFTGALTLGAFSVGAGAETGAGEYRATVDWRDGSAPEASAVSVAGSTVTVTSAGHAYTTAGPFHPLVTLTDDTGNSATLADTVNVVPDVTSRVRVVGLGGPVNPVTGLVTSADTLSNVGAVTIHGPLYLVVHGLPAGVTLANAAGTVIPAGSGAAAEPYAVLSLAQLTAGQTSAPVTLQFSDPSLAPFAYGVTVIDGPAAAPPGGGGGPALDYSTYLGGSLLDLARAVAVDAAGNTYVAGVTSSSDFPSLNSLNPGVAPSDAGFASDAFVTKLDPSGQIVYATFLGDVGAGPGSLESVTGLAVNSAGDVYVTGRTNATDFPTVNALQPALNGDGFTSYLVELNAAGDGLVFSTYLNDAVTRGLALDGAGNIYLAGLDGGGIRPTPGAASTTASGSFVAKLNPAANQVLYATFVPGTENQTIPGDQIAAGGEVNGLAVDAAGEVVVTGDTVEQNGPVVHAAQPAFGGGRYDAFAAKLTADGSGLVYWTYLGGSKNDVGNAVALDSAGNAYVVGTTTSADFPTANAVQPAYGGGDNADTSGDSAGPFGLMLAGDAFVTKLDLAGAVKYSTYLGGGGPDTGTAVAVDAAGNAYITGQTDSTNFPTAHALQPTLAGDQFSSGYSSLGRGDAFLTRINAAGSAFDDSTFLGGANGVDGGTAVAVGPSGDAVVAGFTTSADFPTLNAAQPQAGSGPTAFFDVGNTDAFVTRINAAGPGTLIVSNVAFQASEGVPFTGAVAAFTDTDTDTAGNYTATINWGDGTTSAGVVVSDSARGFGFRVEGTHTYAEEGTFSVSVSVRDADGSSGSVSATTISQSLGGPVTYHVGVDTSALAGTSGYLDLQFNPGALPGAQAATATVSLAGGVQLINSATLNETRQAITFGSSVNFDVRLDGPALALPADGDFGSTFAVRLLGPDGLTPLEAPDGTVARITIGPDGSTQFHADAPGVAQASAVTTTKVADAPLKATLVPIQAVEGAPFTGTVATFSDTNPNGILGDFTASVLWGDNTGATAGTVVADGGGRFHVTSSHTYVEAGNFGLRVVITDQGGASVSAAAAPAGPSGLPGLQAARVAFVGQPLALATGDFNGDGKPDLVVWNEVDGATGMAALEVLLGNGDGSFAAPVTLTTKLLTSSNPAIAVADLTGDGKLDIIADGVVFLGHGDGTFTAGPTFDTGRGPLVGIAVADFKGDGKPGLALVNGADSFGAKAGVIVLLGNGDGSFQPGVTYGANDAALVGSVSVVAADFNGDGKPDLAVSILGGATAILLNNGDGTFGSVAQTIAGVTVGAAADLRGDGKIDLVGTDGSHALVLLGHGDGTFQAPVRYDAGPNPSSVIAADLDGDGKPDLVVSGASDGGGSVSTLRGNGDGTFAAPQTFSTLALTAGVQAGLVAADFNGDGKPDVALIASDTVSILLGRGDGSLVDAAYSPLGGSAEGLVAGDFNGDGNADVAAQLALGVQVLAGHGGAFQTAANIPAGRGGFGIVAGDFTGHGNTDIIEGSQLLVGHGDGTFAAPIDLGLGDPIVSGEDSFVNPGATALAAADVNGDGKLDLVIGNRNDAGSQTTVSVLLGHGDGTFSKAWSLVGGGSVTAARLADFSGNGKPDLVLNANSELMVLPGNGDGTFGTPVTYKVPGSIEFSAIYAGDFNGDGKLDLAVAGNGLNILLGNGDGTFGPPVAYDPGIRPIQLAMGDFNGDGKLDFAALYLDHYGSDQKDITLLLGNGDGTFRTGATISTGLEYGSQLAAGDFNGDGKLDLAAAGGSGVLVLLGNGDGTFQPGQEYAQGVGTLIAADLNHDGRADLIAGGIADGTGSNDATVQVFLGNSPSALNASRLYLFPGSSLGLLTADLSGSGRSDLVTLSYYASSTSFYATGAVDVLLNRGDGTFQSASYDLGSAVYSGLVAGDFTGDGKIDLVADFGFDRSTFTDERAFLKGNGDGTFQPARISPASSAQGRLLTADINGDGKLDLVKLERTGADTVIEVDLGNGDGTFGDPIISGPFAGIDMEKFIPGFAEADVTGDGKIDLVVGTTDGSVAVLPGRGDGTFGAPIVSPGEGMVLDAVASDFNGDGKTDLVVAHPDGTISELFGNGDGTFRAPLTYLADGLPYAAGFFLAGELALGDVNGDGTPDFIVGGPRRVAVLLDRPSAAPAQNVADAPLSASGLNHTATQGAPFLGSVARFTDADPLATLDDYTATITWGDGQTSAGTVRADGSGGFTVLGNHTFGQTGALSVTVVITDRDGSTASVSDTITVGSGPDAPLTAIGKTITATSLVPFTGVVATFADPDTAAVASDFTATITWGDGQTSPGVVQASASGGFVVAGTNTYAAAGTYPTAIAIVDTGGATASANGSAVVTTNADAPLTAAGPTFYPTEQAPFTGVVATFTDADPAGVASDYTATITWGDGQTSAGRVAADPLVAGQFEVTGTHSYPAAGPYGVTVSVLDSGGAAATADSTAAVADAPLAASGTPVSATEGTAFASVVATFTDANPFSGAGDFTATIAWGDGQTSAATVAADAHAPGHFTVSGSNTYTAAGLFAVSVAITDRGGATATAQALAIVADAPLTASGVAIQALAGQPFAGVVASFTDANSTLPAASYAATIFWGDGTTSDGDIQEASSGFSVTGTHTYALYGAFHIRVVVIDPGGATATTAATATVTAPVQPTSAAAVRATEGTSFSGPVASLVVPAWDHGPGDLTVTIDWGDGHTSAGTLVGTGVGLFHVLGTNTYAEEGNYAVTVKVADRSAAGLTIPATAAVADATLTANSIPVRAMAGTPFASPVATFQDAAPGAVAADFSASIAWGDGQSSPGAVAPDPTTAGQFIVRGSNRYASAGTFPVSVVITDVGGYTVTALGSSEVRSATGASFAASAGVPFSTVVASIAGAGLDAAGDFGALIDWGDGHTSPGLLTLDPAGGNNFLVLGSSTYLGAGHYPVTVAIDSSNAFRTSVSGTATVGPAPDAPLTALPGLPIAAQSGSPLHSVVAAFNDTDPGGSPADFTGNIDWGDGSTSSGSVMAAPGVPGLFFVLGSHTYAASGPVPVRVSIQDVGGSLAVAGSQVLVAEPTPVGPSLPLVATALVAPSGATGRGTSNLAALAVVPGELAAPTLPPAGPGSVASPPAEALPAAGATRTIVATATEPGGGSIFAVSAALSCREGQAANAGISDEADDFWPWVNDRPASDSSRNRPQTGGPAPGADGEQVPELPSPDAEGGDLVPFAAAVNGVFILGVIHFRGEDDSSVCNPRHRPGAGVGSGRASRRHGRGPQRRDGLG